MSMSRRVASRAPATSTETGWSSRKSTRPLRSCRVAETLPVPNADRRLEFLFEIASDISHESVQRRDRLIETLRDGLRDNVRVTARHSQVFWQRQLRGLSCAYCWSSP